ncbi:hypothetical protein Tco_1568830 [Tanacetum coccineum]
MYVHNSLPNTLVNSEHGDDYIQDPNPVTRKKQYDAMIEFPKCVCNASESFKKHNQLLKLMQFLMGLDDSYMQIRSSILSREVLPDVRSAYATISSEESYRVAAGSIADLWFHSRNQVSIFPQNLNSGPRPNNMNNNRQGGGLGLVCENYGFNGHTIDRCFKIIGYPVDFGKKKSNKFFKRKNISNNNSVGTNSSSGFTDEQMATLISLIKDNKVGKNVQANMAGANQHMTYTDNELDNVMKFSSSRIKSRYPMMMRLENDLNRDKKSKSDSSSSSVSSINHNTFNFLVDNPRNDADSIGEFVPIQNEGVATLKENVFSEGNLDQNSSSSHGVQNVRRSSRQSVFLRNYNDALLRNGTWEIVELPEGRKAIGSKWIYKIKFKSSAEVFQLESLKLLQRQLFRSLEDWEVSSLQFMQRYRN